MIIPDRSVNLIFRFFQALEPGRKGGALINQLHEQTSLMATANPAFGEWVNLFADAKLTAALFDRLAHHCEQCRKKWLAG